MMLDELIDKLRSKLLQEPSLEVFCYYFLNRSNQIYKLDKSQFTGEVEQIAVQSFLEEYADVAELEQINKKLGNIIYRKSLNLYHFLGLSLQDKSNNTEIFKNHLQKRFDEQSFKYKYLISKVFNEFEDKLNRLLRSQVETKDHFILVLQHLYLEENINKNQIISYFEKEADNLDIIDLILLEDLQNIKAIGYDKLQEKLFKDIRWCAGEIQSKHEDFDNSEDKYNEIFKILLSAKEYRVEGQTRRGQSFNGTQSGELDLEIFTKEENIPLSIFEAFIITSLDKGCIIKHLKKLSENYDPNGLKNNYAVIYAKSKEFADFWEKYKNFVPEIDFEHELLKKQVDDISDRGPEFTGIRVGLTKHRNRGKIVQIYHIFMDMNFTNTISKKQPKKTP